MSKILDELKRSGDQGGRCHVRVSDNMTYGPVALSTLCQWAAQGRVTSDSEISFNRRDWVRAETIPELGLEWIATSDTAEPFGPFNLQAISQLVRRGLISPDASLRHRETGEILDVAHGMKRTAEPRPLDAAAARLVESVPDHPAMPSLVTHAVSREAAEADAAPVERPDAEALAAMQDEQQGRVAELEKRLADQADELEAALTAQRAAEKTAEMGRSKIDTQKAAAAALQEEAEDLRTKGASLEKDVAILRNERDAKQDRVAGLTAEVQQLQSQLAEAGAAREAQLSGYAEQVAQAAEEKQQLEARIAELEPGERALEQALSEVSRLQDILAETQAQQKALQSEIDAREIEQGGKIAELEELLNVVTEGRAEARAEVQAVQKSLADALSALEQKELALDLLQHRVEEVEDAVARAHEHGATVQAERDRLAHDNTALSAELEDLRITLNERQEEIALLDQTRESEQATSAAQIQELKDGLTAAGRAWEEREESMAVELSGLREELRESREQAARREEENGLAADTLRAEMAALSARLAETDDRLKAAQVDRESLNSELDVARQDLAAQARQTTGLEQKLKRRDEEILNGEATIKTLEQELAALQSTRAAEVERGRAAEASLVERESELQKRVAELESELQDRVAGLESQLQRRETELRSEVERLTGELEAARAEAQAMAERESAVRKSVEAHASHASTIQQALDAREQEAARLRSALEEVKSKHEVRVTEHVEMASRVQEEKERLEARLAALESEWQARLADLQETLDDRESELEAARSAQATARQAAEKAAEQAAALQEQERAAGQAAVAEIHQEAEALKARVASLEKEADHLRRERDAGAPELPREWFLRYDGENVLGPVSMEVLVGWARDCRVAPEHDVSPDRIFWAPAGKVAELEMEWMVTLVDGTDYGPINKHAVLDLVADGAVAEAAVLTHCRTGEQLSVAEVRGAPIAPPA